MKIKFLPFLPLLVSAIPVSAVTVSVSDFAGSVENKVLRLDGSSLVPTESLVRVGFFTELSGSVTTALSSPDKDTVYTALSTYFVGLGEGIDSDLGTRASGGPRVVTRPINGISQPGRIFGSIDDITPGSYSQGNITGVASGTQLFVLVYNAATTAAATELAIFSANDATWKMPSENLSTVTLNTVAVDTPSEIYRGTPGSIRLAALVPEPSSSLLVLGVAALGLRRRRR